MEHDGDRCACLPQRAAKNGGTNGGIEKIRQVVIASDRSTMEHARCGIMRNWLECFVRLAHIVAIEALQICNVNVYSVENRESTGVHHGFEAERRGFESSLSSRCRWSYVLRIVVGVHYIDWKRRGVRSGHDLEHSAH